jgi:Leucine-rich repeat (LRR) protein
MSESQKELCDMDENEAYTEAQREIEECREYKTKEVNFYLLNNLREIPPEIMELDNLETLCLVDIKIKEIPGFIGNISSLETLFVGFNCPPTDEHEYIILPPQLGNLRNLRRLELRYGIKEIPEWVWDLENLEGLVIYNDYIKTIPPQISNLKNLEFLMILGKNISILPDEIGDLPLLTKLFLNCPQLKNLPENFVNLKKIRGFLFSSCNLAVLPDLLSNWKELTRLIIEIVNIPQGSLATQKRVLEKIWNLKNLRVLRLGNIVAQIPESLGNLSFLTNLSLSGTFKAIPQSIGKCKNLKFVAISSDKLSELPDSFCKLKKLEYVSIDACNLKKLPHSFRNLSYVKEMSVKTANGKELAWERGPGGFNKLVDMNWNTDGFNKVELANHCICYAPHIPNYRGNWAFEDMLKFNNIFPKTMVSYRNEN